MKPFPTADIAAAHWAPPDDRTRGSVLILPGHDEDVKPYEHLGAALALAGYTVRALNHPDLPDAVAVLRDQPRAPRFPQAVLGADTGALLAVQLARTPGVTVDALVLAGLPSQTAHDDVDSGPGSIPTLVLHGELHQQARTPAARAPAADWMRTRFVTVADSGHDVLCDTHHRSVTAEITQFLEMLRAGISPLRVSLGSTW